MLMARVQFLVLPCAIVTVAVPVVRWVLRAPGPTSGSGANGGAAETS